MKTKCYNLLCVILCATFLCSCSNDDDVSAASLVGTWRLTSLSIESSYDFNGDGMATNNLFVETDCYEGDFLMFSEDETARIVSGFTFISVDDNLQSMHECFSGFDRSTTWTQDGNTVVVDNGGNDIIGTISGNTLTAVIQNGIELEKLNGTTVEDVFETVTVTYVKE